MSTITYKMELDSEELQRHLEGLKWRARREFERALRTFVEVNRVDDRKG